MAVDTPAELRSLITWLEAEGYVPTGADKLRERGDRHARWVSGDMQVRIGRERDRWFVDLCCRAWGGTWHDAQVVEAALHHRDISQPANMAELVSFIQDNLGDRLAVASTDTRLAEELEVLEKTLMRTQIGL